MRPVTAFIQYLRRIYNILRRSLENWNSGIVIGGKRINNLRYADDTTLIAENEQEMSDLIERVERSSSEFDLRLNRQKTKLIIYCTNKKNHPIFTM